jgi:hypothetical protein
MISGAGIGTSLSGDEPEESNDEGLGTSARQIRVVPSGVRLAQDWQIRRVWALKEALFVDELRCRLLSVATMKIVLPRGLFQIDSTRELVTDPQKRDPSLQGPADFVSHINYR